MILILDFGSQYTQLIARRVRELGVYCEALPPARAAEKIAAAVPGGIILSGGPDSVAAAAAPLVPDAVFACGAPVLAICYGMQATAARFGGVVRPSSRRSYGRAVIHREAAACDLLDAAFADANELPVWMSHGDHVDEPPPGFAVVARAKNGVVAAIADSRRKIFGLQFHPEVSHTRNGGEILRRFLRSICGLAATWTTPNFIARAVAEIRARVGDEKVLLALSGGVDSAVAASLLRRAIGDNLTCVLIDNGLMRAGEVAQARAVFAESFGARLVVEDCAARFFEALQGVVDPEEKRRVIGREFARAFERRAAQLEGMKWLAQGTIYPDVIESAKSESGAATVIKTHHNVGGLPEKLSLKIIEPLRDLFKDEVRRLGVALGLPPALIERHPFPGPGLAVRVLGEVTPPRAEIARAADAIFTEELRAAGQSRVTAQAFAVLLPVKTVGVMGDFRTYENVVALRAVTTDDFMTADWTRLPYDLLARASSRIINEVAGVNRVVYDISSKPPATVEWE